MNDDSIKQGAYYLLRGGTLLSEPCKKCGNLQIKFKGEILCLNCHAGNKILNSSITKGDSDTTQLIRNDDGGKNQQDLNSVNKLGSRIELNFVLDEIERKLISNISDFGVNISIGDYSREHRKALKGIKECLKIIEIIRRLKGIKSER
jgi:uncharacterized Zn finger protein (UPF0148 family)